MIQTYSQLSSFPEKSVLVQELKKQLDVIKTKYGESAKYNEQQNKCQAIEAEIAAKHRLSCKQSRLADADITNQQVVQLPAEEKTQAIPTVVTQPPPDQLSIAETVTTDNTSVNLMGVTLQILPLRPTTIIMIMQRV